MKKLLAVILAVICIATLSACGGDKNDDSSSSEQKVEITTPFAVLKVAKSFDENVSHSETSKDPYTLSFVAKEDDTELFSLIFNGKGKTLLGTIIGEKENTVIYMNMADLDAKSDNYEKYLSYQGGLNDILNGLTEDYNFVAKQAIATEDNSTFDIKTPVVTIKYPNKWKEIVKVEVTDDRVQFSDEGTPVFDLVFKKCDGNLIGTYKDTPIYVVEYTVKTDEQIAMKEDINVILQNLQKDSDFSAK